MTSIMFAQVPNIINPSFESWVTPLNYEEPDSLLTSNSQLFYMGAPSNVQKVSVAQHGMFAAKLNTILVGTDTVMGMLLFGKPKPGGGGLIPNPYTRRPDSIVFYAKYDIQAGDVGNFILAFMVHGITCDTTIYVVHQFVGQNNTFTKYKFAIPWGPIVCPPDSMTYILSSSRLDPPRSLGSTITIDNMYFVEGSSSYYLPNGDFENWTQNYGPEDPLGWATLNIYCEPGNLSVIKSNDALSGTYSLSLKTVRMIFGDTIGYIGNGRFGNNGPEGGMFVPDNVYIDSITGFYKYFPVGIDTAIAGAFISNAVMNDTSNTIQLLSASVWTPFAITVPQGDYDTLGIAFASSNLISRTSYNIGSELRIDSLTLHYRNYVGINQRNNQQQILCYPSPSKDILYITLPENISCKNIKISDVFGKEIYNYNITNLEGKIVVNINRLPAGLYFITSAGDKKAQGSFVVYR